MASGPWLIAIKWSGYSSPNYAGGGGGGGRGGGGRGGGGRGGGGRRGGGEGGSVSNDVPCPWFDKELNSKSQNFTARTGS